MATKIQDMSNTGSLNFIPQSDDYGAAVVDFTQDVKSILDVMNELGYNVFGFNSEQMRPLRLEGDGLAQSYRVKEFGHFGLGGEYNDQIGVKLHTGAVRYIDYAYGREEYFQAMKFDPVNDGDRNEHAMRVSNDYATALVKNRPIKFMEQVINSGIKFETADDYAMMYEAYNLDFEPPVDPNNMTPDELESFIIFVSAYFDEKSDVKQTPVVMLGNKEWSKIVKSENFQSAIYSDMTNDALLRNNDIGIVHNVVVGKHSRLGMPFGEFKDVHRLVLAPGTAQFQERTIRPVKYRPYSEALGVAGDELSTLGNKVIDAEFFTGTYEQWCVLTDNLENPSTGVRHFTERYFVCGPVEQDASKVHFGQVHGETPTVKEAVNRTMADVIKATYDNTYTGETNPATDNGDTHGLTGDAGLSLATLGQLYAELSALDATQLSAAAVELGLTSAATVDDIMALATSVHQAEIIATAIVKVKGGA